MLAAVDNAAENCRTEIAQYRKDQNVQSDEEAQSNTSIFEAFYNSGGSDATHSMTNLSAADCMRIWNHISSFVNKN